MKKSSRDKLNLFFSSFLVIGFIICSYFFMSLTSRVGQAAANLISVAVYVLFGLIIFYATRVGEGEAIKRFSPIVLCILDVPALFIIIASLAPAFPLHDALATQPVVLTFACIALGYGIPYTFLSGFELKEEISEDALSEALVQGGIAEELAQADEVATEEDVEDLEALDGVEAEEVEAEEVEAEETADAE